MTIELVDEAVARGARREAACEAVGLYARSLEAPVRRPPNEHVAIGPSQVWS